MALNLDPNYEGRHQDEEHLRLVNEWRVILSDLTTEDICEIHILSSEYFRLEVKVALSDATSAMIQESRSESEIAALLEQLYAQDYESNRHDLLDTLFTLYHKVPAVDTFIASKVESKEMHPRFASVFYEKMRDEISEDTDTPLVELLKEMRFSEKLRAIAEKT